MSILEGKVVLVTGGAGGLGRAIVKACLENKAKVVVADINDQLANETASELQKTCQPDHIAVTTLDVSDESSAAAAIDFTVRHYGRLDVLINNAGVMDGFHSAASCGKEDWDRVLGINLTGSFLMTKYAVKHFLARFDGQPTGGSIVNIGSAASQRGAAAGVAYTASKHGLLGLTKNTAAVYAKQGVRTNIVLPGAMGTNIGTSMPENIDMEGATVARTLNTVLQFEPVVIDDLAKTVVHLASESARGINGAVVNVDNGWNAF